MKKIPEITDAELQIMKILWDKSPMTIKDIMERIDTSWTKTTVHTLFSRLENKGAIKMVGKSPLKNYIPLIEENECLTYKTQSFLQKTFGGSLSRMVLNFIEDDQLTDDDIKELKSVLLKGQDKKGSKAI